MRFPSTLTAGLVALGSLAGCGGGGDLKEGIPKVDMTKDYTPAATVGPITPKDQRKAIAAQKKGAAAGGAAAAK